MCQANNRFIFCSYSHKYKGSNTNKRTIYYSWYLTRYLGSKKTRIRGRIMMPTKDLGSGVTIDAIRDQLNTDFASFDFTYTPSHRDCLKIRVLYSTKEFKYFDLIFIDGQWKEGSNYAFTSITEKIASGRIKKLTGKQQYISERNSWLKVSQGDFDTIFSKIFTTKNSYQALTTLRNRVLREPHLFFKQAQKLIQATVIDKRRFASFIFVILFYSKFETEKIKTILFDILQTEENTAIISPIISVFGTINKNLSDDFIDLICTFKNHEDDVKLSIMYAFDALKHAQVVDTFIEFSNDTNPEIRKTALFKLRFIIDDTNASKIKKVFWKHVEDSARVARLEAILGLAELKDEHIKDSILKELEQIDEKHILIIDAIEALNDKSFIPHIEFQIEKHKNAANHLTELLQSILDHLNSIA